MNVSYSFSSVRNNPFPFITYLIMILLIIVILFQVFALLVVFRHNGGIRRNSNVINYV